MSKLCLIVNSVKTKPSLSGSYGKKEGTTNRREWTRMECTSSTGESMHAYSYPSIEIHIRVHSRSFVVQKEETLSSYL